MNPKSGKAGAPVEPIASELPGESKADSISAEQIKNQESRYDATGAPSDKLHKPTEKDTEEKSWIEIEMVDEEDNLVSCEK
jgi:hypothetical protein